MDHHFVCTCTCTVLDAVSVDGVELKEGRDKDRLTTATEGTIKSKGALKIGGEIKLGPNPAFIDTRIAIYDRIMEKQKAEEATKPRNAIKIT